ncbi:hypothetical protein [Desulfoluna spongiiphila]|uniref:ELWxxDGT repeat-containing protein n=1 Tax=Desulfoluna spongiiphila TaxID=419481 RepID=A0A1G5DIM9_9BACT|nr:hypothetical protein [Desulfoluna spongiiphila]SCY14260.1 ELWxxDGT repeat-containing protein [Desulfoluna spongiiphila]
MYRLKHISFHRFLSLFIIACLMVGCGGGGGSHEEPPAASAPVALQDPDGVLASIGLTTNEDVKNKISKSGVVALTVEIRNENPALPTEKIITVLKQNNKNIEYKKLEKQGVSKAVISRLKQLPYSPVATKQCVQLPDPEIFPIQASSDALAQLNEAKLKTFNRKLRLRGQAPLAMGDFLALQAAFSKTEIVNNFGNLDQQAQNIPVRRTPLTKALRSTPSTGYTLVNAVDELKATGGIGTEPSPNDACAMAALPGLPMAIAQPGEPVDTVIVHADGNDAVVSIPETGIAVIVASREATIENSEGETLCTGTATDAHVYYLPITHENRCKPFRFVGASTAYSVTLMEIIKPERLTERAFVDGAEYLTTGQPAELLNSCTYFKPKSYTFSTLNSHLDTLDLTFKTESDDAAQGFTFLLYSPYGDVYTGDQDGLSHPVDRDSGIWRLDILPSGSVSVHSEKITGLSAKELLPDDETMFTLTPLVTTDPDVQTKEFMLGIVKTISLKTQGETGAFNEGEVTIDLNTSMAPKLVIPSYIDDIIASGDKLNERVALWQAWAKSEKTGREFEPEAECFKYKDLFDLLKRCYETEHSVDYQNDPEIYECRDQNGESAVCIRGELGPYNMAEPIPDEFKARVVMTDFSKKMQRQYQDVEYLNLLSNYYDLYQNWKDRTVQVDTAQFPYDGVPYKTHEFTACQEGDAECIAAALRGDYPRIPVIIQTNRPIFGVSLDRLIKSTLPITFDYTASDQDVYDTNAANWAFVSYLASQTFNIVTGNFVGMICDSVDLVDDLHDVELAALDDPLGSARVSINRYSSSDPFYGLHHQDAFTFFMSGVPEQNSEVDTYGQKLNYAQIACDCANLSSSGLQFAKNTDLLLNLDYEQLGSVADVYKIIAGTSTAIGGAAVMAEAEEVYSLIREGKIDQAKQRLKTHSDINSLTEGRDLFDDLDSLIAHYGNAGSAGNGNNVLKSNAKYLLGTDKKTRAEVEFKRVSSVPVANLEVVLDRVKIISNYEEAGNTAEINMLPFVGVVSDKPQEGDALHAVFTESEAIIDGNHSWNYLRFGGVKDGQTLETPDTILYSGGGYNAAAVYVELAVMEDDAISVEDDDMIGVFSQTIPLEEIFNKHADYTWAFLGGNNYRLTITEYPIYNSSNQLSLENPLSPDFERQKAHNRNRRPSALVSLTLNLTLGDMSIPHPRVDTSLDLGVMGSGRDTYSMNMTSVASTPATGRLLDVYNGAAIVGENLKNASLVEYGVGPSYYLTNRFTYDVSAFTGELLPIAQALASSKALSTKELPLVRLLPGNRLLFAISHHEGARLMIVTYNASGAMTLEKSEPIKDAEGNPVYSILKAKLSPSRTRLMVPFVPTDYAGTDKKTPAYTHLNLYEIDLAEDMGETTEITRLSSNSFGNGAPLTSIEFLDETHVAVMTRTLLFGEAGYAWWPDWEEVQRTCTSDNLDCLFELVGNDLLLFAINDSHRLELTDAQDIFYAPTNGNDIKSYYPLKRIFSFRDLVNDLQCVATVDGSSSVLRLGRLLFQLRYDTFTDAYYFGDRSSYQNVPSLRYNPDGAYYCADGLTCSGYLKSAVSPRRDDTDVYRSTEKMGRFEFADTDRDLALGFQGTTLHLLSLYDGFAYKGPQITGAILNTGVRVSASEPLTFSFTVTDRDTPLNELDITARIVSVNAPGGYTGTTVSSVTSTPNANGGYDCTVTLTTGDFDTESLLTQRVILRVSDGTYTSEKEFTIYHKPSILIPFADGTHGTELWKTDGSTGSLLNDANPNGDSVSFDIQPFKSGNRYYYTYDDGNVDQRLFTATLDEGATPLKESLTHAAYSSFATLGDRVYFRTAPTSTETALWKTDGTEDGTTQVKSISGGNIQQLQTIDDTLFFYVNGHSSPDSLWKSDGSAGGTTLVKGSLDIYGHLTSAGGKLFIASDEIDGNACGLWVSDGTPGGTQLLQGFEKVPWKLTEAGGLLFFFAHYQTTDGENTINHRDLWKSNGTVDGTQLVKAMERQGSLDVKEMFAVNGTPYFIMNDAIWTSNGTEAGTVEVRKLYTLPDFNQVRGGIRVVADTFYFSVWRYASSLDYQVYAMQPGTSDALIEVSERNPERNILYTEPTGANEFLYSTQDDTHHYLWKHTPDDGSTLIETTDR